MEQLASDTTEEAPKTGRNTIRNAKRREQKKEKKSAARAQQIGEGGATSLPPEASKDESNLDREGDCRDEQDPPGLWQLSTIYMIYKLPLSSLATINEKDFTEGHPDVKVLSINKRIGIFAEYVRIRGPNESHPLDLVNFRDLDYARSLEHMPVNVLVELDSSLEATIFYVVLLCFEKLEEAQLRMSPLALRRSELNWMSLVMVIWKEQTNSIGMWQENIANAGNALIAMVASTKSRQSDPKVRMTAGEVKWIHLLFRSLPRPKEDPSITGLRAQKLNELAERQAQLPWFFLDIRDQVDESATDLNDSNIQALQKLKEKSWCHERLLAELKEMVTKKSQSESLLVEHLRKSRDKVADRDRRLEVAKDQKAELQAKRMELANLTNDLRRVRRELVEKTDRLDNHFVDTERAQNAHNSRVEIYKKQAEKAADELENLQAKLIKCQGQVQKLKLANEKMIVERTDLQAISVGRSQQSDEYREEILRVREELSIQLDNVQRLTTAASKTQADEKDAKIAELMTALRTITQEKGAEIAQLNVSLLSSRTTERIVEKRIAAAVQAATEKTEASFSHRLETRQVALDNQIVVNRNQLQLIQELSQTEHLTKEKDKEILCLQDGLYDIEQMVMQLRLTGGVGAASASGEP